MLLSCHWKKWVVIVKSKGSMSNIVWNEFASEILYVLRDTYEEPNNIESKNWEYQERFRNSVLDDAWIGHLIIHRIDGNIEKVRVCFIKWLNTLQLWEWWLMNPIWRKKLTCSGRNPKHKQSFWKEVNAFWVMNENRKDLTFVLNFQGKLDKTRCSQAE